MHNNRYFNFQPVFVKVEFCPEFCRKVGNCYEHLEMIFLLESKCILWNYHCVKFLWIFTSVPFLKRVSVVNKSRNKTHGMILNSKFRRLNKGIFNLNISKFSENKSYFKLNNIKFKNGMVWVRSFTEWRRQMWQMWMWWSCILLATQILNTSSEV